MLMLTHTCHLDLYQLVNTPAQRAQAPAAAEGTGKVAQAAGPAPAPGAGPADDGIDSDLQARLDNLRKM